MRKEARKERDGIRKKERRRWRREGGLGRVSVCKQREKGVGGRTKGWEK